MSFRDFVLKAKALKLRIWHIEGEPPQLTLKQLIGSGSFLYSSVSRAEPHYHTRFSFCSDQAAKISA